MIRYRPARTEPGVNPPAPVESEETSRPTGDEEGLRRRAASATEGLARSVAIFETEEIASPQEGQKREPSGISAEQPEQRITLCKSYREASGNADERSDLVHSARAQRGQDLVGPEAAASC